MSRDEQAGAAGLQMAGEAPATVRGNTLDDFLGTAHAAAAAPPKPYGYIGIDRIENGFIVRGHTGNMGEDYPTRVAYSPAEAGAAVAELLQRHMAEADLKGAPGFAVLRFEHARPLSADLAAVAEAANRNATQAAAAAKPKAATAPAKPKPEAAKKPAPKKSASKA